MARIQKDPAGCRVGTCTIGRPGGRIESQAQGGSPRHPERLELAPVGLSFDFSL